MLLICPQRLWICHSGRASGLLWCAILFSKFWLSYQLSPFLRFSMQTVEGGSQSNQKDFQAMMEFWGNISSSRPLNWHPHTNCCNWEGITCEDNTVTRLWLPERGLKGVLSSSLGSLEQLKELNLSYNLLSSAIPNELLFLQHLRVLDLSFNNLSGPVPPSEGLQSIQSFNISSNFFTGGLLSLGIAPNLSALNISNNSFTGPIPTNICRDSRSVRMLDFSLNQFAGNLDEGLGACSALEEFNAGFNNLIGFLPKDLYGILSLQQLFLPFNRFAGILDTDIGHLENLIILSLYANNFTGKLPVQLGKLEKLEQLILYSNRFSGILPYSLSLCKKLRVLNLRNNSFSGIINLDFTSLPDLMSLDLSSNQLSGRFPPSLSTCRKMNSLSLGRNKLEGQLPLSMTSLKSLTFFSISNNSMTNITRALQILQDFRNLSTLILFKNFHGETIPKDIKGFQGLQILALGNCALTGQIPDWLQNCSKLQVLDLSWNSLRGSIPPWIGRFKHLFYLDLSNNSLSGGIPLQITKLPDLIYEQNMKQTDQASFALPLYIKHEENASGLQYKQLSHFPPSLYLNDNELNGIIWPEFGNMKMLHILDLRNNNFTGMIPAELSTMTNLECLDLSNNNITGVIPPILKELTFLAKFNVANNHLEGIIPSGGQFNTFPKSSFDGNKGLCGFPLPACNGTALPPVFTAVDTNRIKQLGRRTIFVITVSVGLGVALILAAVIWSLSRRHIEIQVEENEADCNMSCSLSDALGSTLVLLFQDHDFKDLTLADLLKATNNFDQANIIGCGGFGLVYRATLDDGTKVAIKRLTGDCDRMEREFKAEVEALSRAQHKNLVPLQGYCRYGNCRLLIYSYMENGSLDYWLHERLDGGSILDWPTRLRIAQGASRGLAYMHRICEPHIVHRDIKSSNILLDDKFEAYVADFGLSRLILPYKTHVSTELVGTLGYIPPEYGQAWIATLRGDVYSFGVVVLELLTKRRPAEVCKGKMCTDLVAWVQQMRSEGKQEEIFDPLLRDKGFEEQMLQVLDVACMCTNQNPFKRPTIQEVVYWLENVGVDAQQMK